MGKRFIFGIIYVAVIGALSNVFAIFINRDKLDENKRPFKSKKWERNGKIYDKLKIRKWKGKLPDMSKILPFLRPKKVVSGTTSKDLRALIKETCVAEIVHTVLMILSIGVVFICPGKLGVILYIFCFIGNLPFILIQRYNRPQYLIAEERLTRREERLRK